jgi:D-alanine-D-alanine ligase
MDKGVAKQVLAANGIQQPEFRTLRESHISDAALRSIADDLGFPLFVKPANMGSSVGISKAKNADELRRAVDAALTYDEWVVFEESVTGREIEVAVLGNLEARASVPGEIVPSREFYDYEDKYLGDGAQLIVPARLSPEEVTAVQKLALVVFHTLRAEGMARVDFFYEDGGRGFLCNEINTIPGFTPISMYPKLWQASGLSYSRLLDELIELALERHARRRRNTSR